VKEPHTHGVATLLIEHTAESFRAESREAQGAAFDNAPQRRAFSAVALDHVTLSTADAATTAQKFADVLGLKASAPVDAERQPLRLIKVDAGNAFMELAQPLSGEHRIAKAMEERGGGMYAVGVTVDNIDEAIRDLRSKGVYVSDAEFGVWPGTRTARVNPAAANGVNIVLVERRPDLL
jgi:catechol 2,3-dioxygenase-like lactoylglutathione lyase family enzyme